MGKYYERQILLDNFGIEGQRALSQATVLIVGLGGLGCSAAQQLTVMGVGRLILVDGDTVSASNLSRQILFAANDVGALKVLAAKRALSVLRPECEITTISEFLRADLCEQSFSQATVIVDATDNFETKFLINAAGVKFSVPVVWANAQKWEGQLAVFDSQGGACYQCFLPELPQKKSISCGGACNEVGVLGAVPNVIGNMQALECVKVICARANIAKVPKPLWAQLQSYSFRDATFFKTKITRNALCPVCGTSPSEIVLPNIEVPNCGVEFSYPILSAHEVFSQNKFCLVDVRERDEIEALPIRGALSLPLSEIEAGTEKAISCLDLAKGNALFCKSGKRSRKAFDLITSQCSIPANKLFVLGENAEQLATLL